MPKFCLECGAGLGATAKFCAECGTRVTAEAAAGTPPARPAPTPHPLAAPPAPVGAAPPQATPAGGAWVEPFPVAVAPPAGWKTLAGNDDIVVVGPSSGDGRVMVHAGLYDRFEPQYAALSTACTELGIQAWPATPLAPATVGGRSAMAGSFTGQNSVGLPIAMHVVLVLSGDGCGAVVFGIDGQEQAAAIERAARAVAEALTFGPLSADLDAMVRLSGTWTRYKGSNSPSSGTGSSSLSSFSTYTLNTDGTYAFRSESMVSASVPGMSGFSGSQDAGSGRWAVLKGKLVMANEQGSRTVAARVDGERIMIGNAVYVR